MARGLTANLKAELEKPQLALAWFVEIGIDSGTVRVWSGVGDKVWNSVTWKGVGKFGGVSPIVEETGTVATGIKLSLSGIPSDLIGEALTEIRHGKPGSAWLAALDSSEAVIADPYVSFSGLVDTCDIEETGETSSILITVESELLRLKIPNERRYTHSDQILDYATDKGFEYMAELHEQGLIWAKSRPIPNAPPSSPNTPPFYPGSPL